MKLTKVGSPILADFYDSKKHENDLTTVHYSYRNDTQDRKPIITPFIARQSPQDGRLTSSSLSEDEQNLEEAQQFLLLPNADGIQVLSMEHGQVICNLEPFINDNDEGSMLGKERVTLNSAELVKVSRNTTADNEDSDDAGDESKVQRALSLLDKANDDATVSSFGNITEEWVVIGGMSNGTLQEWPLSNLVFPLSNEKDGILPRRIFELPKSHNGWSVSQMTSPSSSSSALEGDETQEKDLIFALVSAAMAHCHLLKITLPSLSEDQYSSDCEVVTLEDKVDTKNISMYGKKNRRVAKEDKNDDDDADQSKSKSDETPFVLLSCSLPGDSFSSSSSKSKFTILVVVGIKGFDVYCEDPERIQDSEKAMVNFRNLKYECDITAATISPNGQDIVLGLQNGCIHILKSAISSTVIYVESIASVSNDIEEHQHPENELIIRKLHWHPLPVKTLCYLGIAGSKAESSLLSGGEEAVLINWNLGNGGNATNYTLPRITKSCMTHITANKYVSTSGTSRDDIVVRSMCNTVQAIQSYNGTIRWKIQGLASANNECVPTEVATSENVPSAIMRFDRRTQMPLLTRLDGAPGFIHWFDPSSGQVAGELEVAAYNRISRRTINLKAYPRPTVTHFALSSSGNDMITVDTMLSENPSMGRLCEGPNGAMSLVTNIKFWAFSKDLEDQRKEGIYDKEMPFDMIAAMPSPHGMLNGDIDALAITGNGMKACSLSTSEGAFHIWQKIAGETHDASKKKVSSSSVAPPTPAWRRHCKITVPSGYSNVSVNCLGRDKSSIVSFSNDGSVLAIAFGKNITLWDHSSATMLSTICASEPIYDLQFVASPTDMLLAVGESSVSMLPPFGGGYAGDSSWCYKLPKGSHVNGNELRLDLVTPLAGRKQIAAAVRQKTPSGEKKSRNIYSVVTRVYLLDANTGWPTTRENGTPVFWNVPGSVKCIQDLADLKNDWCNEDGLLLVFTDNHEMYILRSDDDKNNLQTVKYTKQNIPLRGMGAKDSLLSLTSSTAPKLALNGKRAVESENMIAEVNDKDLGSFSFDQKMMGAKEGSVPSYQLPSLSGAFTSALIGRQFKRKKV